MAKIYLDCADNARDIGGMVAADGTVIAEHKLIRSNALYKASDADLELLTDKYNLKRIIDLRTELESSQHPDSVPDGVEYIHIPILTQEAIGITHNNSVMQDTAELLQSGKIKVDMCEMYRNMMSSPYSQSQFAKVMKLFLKDCSGATLWHCASGKDRCGMVSALIELALGVSKEDIMSDYMETAKVTSSQSEAIWSGVFNRTKNIEFANNVRDMMTVKPDYIETAFDVMGDTQAFLKDKIGLSSEDIVRLREIYCSAGNH